MPPPITSASLSCGLKKRPFYALPAFMLAMLCLALSAGFYVHTQHKLETWERAEGVVVANVSQTSSSRRGNKTKHYARVRFTSADGQVYRIRQQSGSSSPDFELGAKVQVLYPADKPTEGVIDSPWVLYVWSGISAFCGVVLLLSALLKRVWGKA